MPFGIASAPEIFQRIVVQVFGDIPNTTIYFDDLIIATINEREHDIAIKEVMKRSIKFGIKFNKKKTQFKVKTVKYLGQIFSAKGMNIDPENVESILKLKEPQEKTELKTLMGMTSYLSRYIPQLSKITAPLRKLTRKDVKWSWEESHRIAFNEIKRRIALAPTLKCYSPNAQLVLQTDASKDGLGGCLLINGEPISFASRSLSVTEQKYAQIEKELLAIVFSCNKFHTYIYGQPVIVNTDHKPLENIIKKELGKISPRLQRMCLALLKYDIDIVYKPGRLMYIADLLSRNYINTPGPEQEIMLLDRVHAVSKELPMTQEKLQIFQTQMKEDEECKEIIRWNQVGWPRKRTAVSAGIQWAWDMQEKIEIQKEIIIIDGKIFIPKKLVGTILELLHQPHFGINKTKKMAQQTVWWPGMSSDIENMIRKCTVCEKFTAKKQKETIIQRDIPAYPFEIIGTDICTYAAEDYLVIACYRSRWLDIVKLKQKTAHEVIEKLKIYFANHGIPRIVVSDNMPFNSMEFERFARDWNFEQSLSSPYYPKSNGFSEKMVGISKQILKKISITKEDLQLALLNYRNSPLDGIDITPAQLAASRNLRSKIPTTIDALKPKQVLDVEGKLEKLKSRQKQYYNATARKGHVFEPVEGEAVLLRNKETWEPAVIKEKYPAPRSYVVTTAEGKEYRRNSQDLRKSYNPPTLINHSDDEIELGDTNGEVTTITPMREMSPRAETIQNYQTRSGRVSKAPAKYKDYVMCISAS